MKINIVIIGLGNIGKRHLQAVSRLNNCEKFVCYDVANVESVKEFCSKNGISTENIRLTSSFDDAINAVNTETVVIVATTAKGRAGIIEKVMMKRPLAIIGEKPLTQNLAEYEQLVKLADQTKVPVYCNFPKHMYPFYQRIEAKLKQEPLQSLHAVTWGGMACAGIHAIELMTWLLDVRKYKILKAVSRGNFSSKRPGFEDFAADLTIECNDSIVCTIQASEEQKLETYDLATAETKYSICESAGKMIETNNKGEFLVKDLEILHVSQITDQIVQDIVAKRKVRLPDLAQSLNAHKILFESMKLSGAERLNIT